MRLSVAAAGVTAIAVAAVLAVQRLNEAERYRQFVATGEQALASGNSYAAIEAFSGAIALRPDSMAPHLRRGEAYQAQRRLDDAMRDFRDAAMLQPGATDPLIALASLHDGQGDSGEAAEWYGRAAAIDRQSPTLLYRLALARYRSGQPAAAIEPLRQATTIDNGFDEALYLLGLSLRDTRDPAGAIDALERAVRANPTLAPAREELADLYHAEGRPTDEMTQLTALATLAPGRDRDVAIALSQASRREFDLAEATLAAALVRQPDDSQVLLTLGRVRVQRAETASDRTQRMATATQAVAPLEAALGGTVRRSEGLAYYGRALYLRGEVEEATRILREAVATIPFSRIAFAFLADASESLGEAADARSWLARYDALAGDAAPSSERQARARRLGGLALAAGDYTDARRRLEPLQAQFPNDALLLAWLAEARWHTGDAEGARQAFAAATTIAPRDPAVRRLRTVITTRTPD